MKHVSWRFQNSSTILSARVCWKNVGLWHGIACQRKTHLFVKFVNEPTLAIWFEKSLESFLECYSHSLCININIKAIMSDTPLAVLQPSCWGCVSVYYTFLFAIPWPAPWMIFFASNYHLLIMSPITADFWTCTDSSAVGACTIFCGDMILKTEITQVHIFRKLWRKFGWP